MIAESMNGVPYGLEGIERERPMTARTDSGELEASQHAETKRELEPAKCQQLLQQLMPKLQLTLQPKPQLAHKPRSAPTAAREWETVQHRARSQRAPSGPGRGWIGHGQETLDIVKKRECTPLQWDGQGNCVSNQQSALPPRGTGPH